MSGRFGQNTLVNTLDNPQRILFFRLDEFLLMVTPFFLGLLLDSLLVLCLGFALKIPISRFLKAMPRGSVSSRVYWMLPHATLAKRGKFSSLPPSHIREFIR